MLLTKIKLSGFKSFVDPTTILLPSNLVAIVGPNGCGKSNIIDAVCWVMGESSAKYLRGESLTDVIFNGSTTRKPVGLASVELVFDNQDGSIGGEYAGYSEIAIRRQITREAESTYFLNGVRCRRKDIIDIFLGTGLGPRSYSIIGQNMISRIIEAKPDEMRVYLEEAAGVSKYKERRRETENRIQHTKENLDRLNDVRAELEKQLNSLKRQSHAAEKYKLLKQEERTFRAQWLAIQWRQLDKQLAQTALHIQQQETMLEGCRAELGNIHLTIDQQREQQRNTNDVFQEVQRRYYGAGNDITRLEQDIHHHKVHQQQWKTDIEQVEQDWEDNKNQLEEIEAESHDLVVEINELEPEMVAVSESESTAISELKIAEEMMNKWQSQWDEFNQLFSNTTQIAQVEQTRIQHLEQQLVSIKQRQVKLEQEQAQLDFKKLTEEIDELTQQISEAAMQTENYVQELHQLKNSISTVQTTQQQTTQQLDKTRNELQRLRGQQASLEALQQTALGQRNNRVIQWLAQHKLDKQSRLAQHIEVESGWELAVEKVLGANLQAICVEELSDIGKVVNDFKGGSLTAVCRYKILHSVQDDKTKSTLLSKVKSKWPIESLLSGIYIADSESEALAMCGTLAPHESVITPQGVWMSASWLRVSRDESPEAGVFQREQELKQLAANIGNLITVQTNLENESEQQRQQLKIFQQQLDDLQKITNQSHARSAEVHVQQKMKRERLAELTSLAERFRKEQEESLSELQKKQTDLTHARSTWQQAMTALEQYAVEKEALSQRRDGLRDQLQTARDYANHAKEAVHQLEIRLQTNKSQQASLQQTISRMQTQLTTLADRKTALQHELANALPLDSLEKKLAAALSHRLTIEEELNKARSMLDTHAQTLQQLEVRQQAVEHDSLKYRDALETGRVESQGLKVKSETLLEQLKDVGFKLETILAELPEEASAEEWQAQLEQVAQRITRLGAINLVAIEEYTACEERRQYLDKQYADLQQGLDTLENAIAKIDKETRARFKDTFDTVNNRFQELFPKVFGGGRAYLELSGDNLLDAGITVMASPPGKRNSTIHLLSGGEKAMTAIALVFSIFYLNPAPFCLLDEVDAPLDDNNISRFCQLVKSMAEKTQFIFISHNKLAIEMSEHLMGVTMQEPGVSRLVSVDIKEAISLAGA
jgi:chromosome segregation protein